MAFRKNTAAAAAGSEDRIDIYQDVTDRIVRAIEAGAGEYVMPWHGSGAASLGRPRNVASGAAYNGINVLVLWCTAQEKGYSANLWGTYKQWAEVGAQVRKGEKSTRVVLWKQYEKSVEGSEESETRSFARAFPVFNVAQVDGYEVAAPAPVLHPALPDSERHPVAEAFFAALGVQISHGGNKAYYRPSEDRVQMPPFASFHDASAYYGTLAHEAVHWSGAKSRCDRDLTGRFGSEAYGAEELVAELGAAFLCADLEVSPEPRADHAQYVAGWLKIMKADKRAIFTASAKAQAAVKWMHDAAEAAEGKREAA